MTTNPDPQDPSRLDAFDERLRRALEPPPATVARVVQAALEAAEDRPGGRLRRRASQPRGPWRLRWIAVPAAAAAGLALAALLLHRVASPPPPPGPGAERAAVLTITNETGVVAVTTPAGAQMIFLPGDTP